MTKKRENLRNIAIIAHVDHGKTTLVDGLFQQGGIYRTNQAQVERAMDSNDQERERGITILAKCTSVDYGDMTLQIVDTPGHADFGAEVERTLNLVDGVVLLVDAAEGPLPQTRFVLRKALALDLKVVVCINKVDRPDQRSKEVVDEVYELFLDLDAREDQIEFPIIYAIAKDGLAGLAHDEMSDSLAPLVQAITDTVPAPDDLSDEPFCMRVNQLGYDDYVGRLIIGRVHSGEVKPNMPIMLHGEGGKTVQAKVAGLFRFKGTERMSIPEAKCGDIIALAGLKEADIGDTVGHLTSTKVLERINVDAPTVSMTFQVNDGPLSGTSGAKYLTSRQLRDRLFKEAYANVSIKVAETDATDAFRVMGRGELQLAILIETLRRESYELCVRNPEVIVQERDGVKFEPTERLSVDIPTEHLGAVTSALGERRASLLDQRQEGARTRLEYIIPTRGLFGLRGMLLTATRGTILMSSIFEDWTEWQGPLGQRAAGALVSDRRGKTTPYSLFNLQARGKLMVPPSTEVYEGMIVGEHNRDNDLNVNAIREKKQTNVRSSGKDEATTVSPHREMSLEDALEWMRGDEMLEVTPTHLRLRKRVLAANKRPVK